MAEDDKEAIGLGNISAPEYLRPIYANFANVGHTPYDFRITFALVKAPRPGKELDEVRAARALEPEAVADIVVPVGLIQGLISALNDQYNQYLDSYGIPGFDQGGGGRDSDDA